MLTLGRALYAGESLGGPLGFAGGAEGTDFTLSLSGSPTGVALSGLMVSFTGSAGGSAHVGDGAADGGIGTTPRTTR